MKREDKLFLVGKETPEGTAYATASVLIDETEKDVAILFEDSFDAYKFIEENFSNEEGMMIFETTFGAIEDLSEENTFMLMQSEKRQEQPEDENVIYS